jgi:hypothetical protein
MADPTEDKGSLTQKLEEDRQKMADKVSELKEKYNIARWFKASVREYPWCWILAAVLTGFLISRPPARKKEVYLWADPVAQRPAPKIPVQEAKASHAGRDDSHLTDKLWSLTKPILSTYIGREIYERVIRPCQHAVDRGNELRARR